MTVATIASLINMKGGVGKTTLAFNLSWYCAWQANLKVLAVDLDPQANLSQSFMGAKRYREYIQQNEGTIVEIFEQFSAPTRRQGSPALVSAEDVIHVLYQRSASTTTIICWSSVAERFDFEAKSWCGT
ncbi:MAG: ParA family protein [Acidobacteria bacterium]|nr:ParA family protein [Acidobacteriota bacterium]